MRAVSRRVSVANRVVAKFVDILLIFAAAAFLPYPFGPFLAFFYSLFADGMKFGGPRGQSLGKRLMRIQVVTQPGHGTRAGHTDTSAPASFRDSAARNAPVGIATFFAIIPVWGWLILILVGFPLMLMEVYLMLRVESGHRLGDVMADTEVIDVKR